MLADRALFQDVRTFPENDGHGRVGIDVRWIGARSYRWR